MTTSMNNEKTQIGGALADGLTLSRALITPIIMLVIYMGWPDTSMALLASALFVVAAITDLLDDVFGGAETASERKLGWFDDIADIVLIIGCLAMLFWVIYRAGFMSIFFAVPALILILREVVIGLVKGSELRKTGWPETRLGTLKNTLSMLAVCLLIATPWLTSFYDNWRSDESSVMAVYDNASASIWIVGQSLLWVAALLSAVTGFNILRTSTGAVNDA